MFKFNGSDKKDGSGKPSPKEFYIPFTLGYIFGTFLLSPDLDLLITIDNGTTAEEELRLAKMPTIVHDHHNPGDRLPPSQGSQT